jgi:tRNA pseudouridine38-40 synthase
VTGAAERQIRLTLHYDGGGYSGWQVQPGARTVQAELEAVLERLVGAPVRAVAAGRTDTGVHAVGQVVSVGVPARWRAGELRRALNALLPADVWVKDVVEVGADFHARFSAIARGYVYRVGLVDACASPFRRRYCWLLPMTAGGPRLNATLLDDAAARLRGRHSFAAFAKAGQEERGDECTVLRSEWSRWAAGVQYVIVADRFLHHMVRYVVGTVVDVARGRRPAEDVVALLERRSDVTTSPPAPARGLYLARVYYDERDLNRAERIDEDLP